MVGIEPVCLRAVEQWSYGASSTLPRLLHLGSILGAIQKGQWLTSLYMKDAFTYREFTHLQDSTFVSVTKAQHGNSHICLSTSPRVFTKILKACPSAWGQATYVSGRLIDKPRVTPVSSRAQEPTFWLRSLCQILWLIINLEMSDLCPSQLDTLCAYCLARPSDKVLTNWLALVEGFTSQQSPPAVDI